MLKRQDVLVAMKLLSLQRKKYSSHVDRWDVAIANDWRGWQPDEDETVDDLADEGYDLKETWTYARLGKALKLSASETNMSVKRAVAAGLLRPARASRQPTPNAKALLEFLVHGLKYIFPIELGPLARGIPTSFASPVLEKYLFSAGEHIYVWPDARGLASGLSVQPIHPSVPFAVRRDDYLYEMFALLDAIRFGHTRESSLAISRLTTELENI